MVNFKRIQRYLVNITIFCSQEFIFQAIKVLNIFLKMKRAEGKISAIQLEEKLL